MQREELHSVLNLPLTTRSRLDGRLKIDVVMEKEKTKVKSNAVGGS